MEMFDDDGYPTDEALDKITAWPWDDIQSMLDFARELWSYPDRWWSDGDILHLSTGGWSGNESVIDAMEGNRIFWALYWESSRKGGHYTFDLSRLNSAAKTA